MDAAQISCQRSSVIGSQGTRSQKGTMVKGAPLCREIFRWQTIGDHFSLGQHRGKVAAYEGMHAEDDDSENSQTKDHVGSWALTQAPFFLACAPISRIFSLDLSYRPPCHLPASLLRQ